MPDTTLTWPVASLPSAWGSRWAAVTLYCTTTVSRSSSTITPSCGDAAVQGKKHFNVWCKDGIKVAMQGLSSWMSHQRDKNPMLTHHIR